jgi:hypothetical protein
MITLLYDPKKSVNHGVPGSGPGEGAQVHKATEMSPFLLSISELG